jgi:hypothetical protein
MKKILLIIFLSLFLSSSLYSKDEVPPHIKKKLQESLLTANALGTHYVIAFPPNDIPWTGFQMLGMFIAASEETNVRITSPSGFDRSYKVPKMGVISVNTDNDLNWSMMMDHLDDDIVGDKGFVIQSEKPISVYVINSKRVTSEGYLAIPVNVWGTEYIHCSYYDFAEARQWKTGFIVVASQNRTRVTINLKGVGQGISTLGKRNLNTQVSRNLNAGQTYMIMGNGQTRGYFDLTGTIITADKPIGIISFHERCMIPPFIVNNGRDNLISMPPPVRAWAKNYVTIELDRSTDKGDFFRIVAGEDNTYFDVRWFDKRTGAFLGIWDGILDKKGDFAEYHPNSAMAPHDLESIRGVSYFKADKPIFVMQYSYSAYWDRTPKGDYDPFMFRVTPVEQFTKATIFQTPSNTSGDNEYLDNYLNLVVLADAETEEERQELLSTFKMDGRPIVSTNPALRAQKFPNIGSEYDEKLYWVVMRPEIGPHVLEGDVAFGGYIYGFAAFDSYGWVAATAYRNLGEVDTLPPLLEIIEDCGLFDIKATELRNFPAPDTCSECKPQVDQGMSRLPEVMAIENFSEARINYAKEPDKSPNQPWYGTPIDYELHFIYEVIDLRKDAFVHFVLPDNTNENFADTTIYYFADKLELEEEVNFGLKRLFTTNEITVKLKSNKLDETRIKDIRLQRIPGNCYEVIEPKGEVIIPAEGEIDITIRYIPEKEYLDAPVHESGNRYDLDSLVIETECIEFTFPVKGQGGEQYMYVSDWPNQTIPNGFESRANIPGNNILFIQNYNRQRNRNATYPLNVYGIDLDNVLDANGNIIDLAPYWLEDNLILNADNNFSSTYTLPHTDGDRRILINNAAFLSTENGFFERDVPFKSDAVNYLMPGGDNGDDTVSNWQRTVTASNADITNEYWEKERLLRTAANAKAENGGIVTVTNTSRDANDLNKFEIVDLFLTRNATGLDKFKSPDGAFRLNMNPDLPVNNWLRLIRDGGKGNLTLHPEGSNTPIKIDLPIQFIPQDDYSNNSHNVNSNIYVVIEGNRRGEFDTLVGNLSGSVYLPIIDAEGEENTNPILVFNLADYQLFVRISNVGYNNPLTIWNISNPVIGDFEFDRVSDGRALPTIANPWELEVGEEVIIYYDFTPTEVGRRESVINILHSGNITGVEPVEDAAQRQTASVIIAAPGRETGFNSTNLVLGPVLKCDEDNGIITIRNLSATDPITIENIMSATGTDLNNYNQFRFTYNGGDVYSIKNEVIEPNGFRNINVQFIARGLPPGVFDSEVELIIQGRYNDEERPVTRSTVQASATENTVIFAMNKNTNVRNLDPNLILNDGPFNLGISMRLENATPNWADADITEVTLKIRYKLNWLQPVYRLNGTQLTDIILTAGAAAPGWNFSVIEKELDLTIGDPNEPEWEVLTIRGTGNRINNNGVLVYPHFSVKLPSINETGTALEQIEPEIVDISFGDRDFCIYNVPDKGFVDVQACAAVVRTIPIVLGQFNNSINQNATTIDFSYAVPFESDARIEFIDMTGNIVAVPVSEKKARGFYNASIPIDQLSSGAFLVRYTAGPLIKIDKVMIVK